MTPGLEPLARADVPELDDLWRRYDETLSFVPNSLFTMLGGSYRVVAIVTRESVEELGLEPGMSAAGVVKSTSVMVER